MAREEILFDDGFRFVEHDTSYKLVVIPNSRGLRLTPWLLTVVDTDPGVDDIIAMSVCPRNLEAVPYNDNNNGVDFWH